MKHVLLQWCKKRSLLNACLRTCKASRTIATLDYRFSSFEPGFDDGGSIGLAGDKRFLPFPGLLPVKSRVK